MVQEVLARLRERRDELAATVSSYLAWPSIEAWHARTRPLIAQYFPEQLDGFDQLLTLNWHHYPRVISGGTTSRVDVQERVANDKLARDRRHALISHMDALIELKELENLAESSSPRSCGTKVFIVHGHDERRVHETARFVEKLGLTAIVLRELPNCGRTIIEKFEDEAGDIGFAVVLLTGDDVCTASDAPDMQFPRARQNVILELGFFLGRLSRANVCALYEHGVEIPSDYKGVLFVPLDDGDAWRFLLAREMKAAGLPVDLNQAV